MCYTCRVLSDIMQNRSTAVSSIWLVQVRLCIYRSHILVSRVKHILVNTAISISTTNTWPQQVVYYLYGRRKKKTHKVSTYLRNPWVCPKCLNDPVVNAGWAETLNKIQETLWLMYKASRPVINPQWGLLGVLVRGGVVEGHKEDHRAVGGGRHTPQSIVGHLTPARVSAPTPPHPSPSYPIKTQAWVNNAEQGQTLTRLSLQKKNTPGPHHLWLFTWG